MEARQAKPEYTKIVAAIPHSVSEAHYWQWQNEPSVKDAYNRWTDWFTDELFESEMDGVAVVKAKVSRFECDVKRLMDSGKALAAKVTDKALVGHWIDISVAIEMKEA